MSKSRYKLSSTGNTEPPAFFQLLEMGFELSKFQDFYIAQNPDVEFVANSPLELLGLVALYNAKGENWRVSDEQIDQFLEFDTNT